MSEGELAGEALEMACTHGCTVYDMHYLALACRRNSVLATLDSKPCANARRLSIRIAAEEVQR